MGLEWTQRSQNPLTLCLDSGLQSNRYKNDRKPGKDCQACGAGFANRGNRGRIAGRSGQVRAQEFAGGGSGQK